MLKLSDLGFGQENYDVYSKSFVKPYGMILVTGPDRLRQVDDAVRDAQHRQPARGQRHHRRGPGRVPPARHQPGADQCKAGLTFAAALRSILRSDPDIVLLGEIRDKETAHIAIEAALTGHLVLSTLHTNDAPSAIVRSPRWASEPFLVGSALDCVLAQRLARKLCRSARRPTSRPASSSSRCASRGPRTSRRRRCTGPSGCSRLLQDRLQGPSGPARGHGRQRGDREG
jgi:type IV pilus assembly protein PilB